jgi:hypothetical protein
MGALVLAKAHGIIGTHESSWDPLYLLKLRGSLVLLKLMGLFDLNGAQGIIGTYWNSWDRWYTTEAFWIIGTY